MAKISSVYISGWEYNRLLQSDVTQPRNSGVPISMLWRGSHQLWMFERICISREALENEYACSEILGWAGGRILRHLVAEGVVRVVDWADLPADAHIRLAATHSDLREEYSESTVRRLIESNDQEELQQIRWRLLSPLLDELHCVESGAPSNLDKWIKPLKTAGESQEDWKGQAAAAKRQIAMHWWFGNIASPLLPSINVCRPPGSGLSVNDTHAQDVVVEEVESRMIPQLVAGDGDFSGPTGYLPYIEALRKHRAAYEPISNQIFQDWKSNWDHLRRVRDRAKRYLWPAMHDEWIPRILSDDSFSGELTRLMRAAILSPRMVELLDSKPTRIALGGLTGVAASQGAGVAAAELNLDAIPHGETIVSILGGALAASAAAAHLRNQTADAARIAVFYQKIRSINP